MLIRFHFIYTLKVVNQQRILYGDLKQNTDYDKKINKNKNSNHFAQF